MRGREASDMVLKSSVSSREKKLAVATFALASFGLCFVFVVEPLYKSYKALNQEIKEKQLRLAKNQRLMREKDAITKEFQKYSELITTKKSHEEEMALVLSEIEKTGKAAQMYLSDVKPQRIKDMDFYRELLVEIKFQANMQCITKFIYNLQNSASLLKVKRLQINTKGIGSSEIEGTIQISKIVI